MSTVNKLGGLSMLFFLLLACKKPTENIKLVVDTDILKYTALVYVTDGTDGGSAPADAKIAIKGNAADDIYELSGKKDIKLSGGVVTIGLDPDKMPLPGNPIRINIEVSAAGYQTAVKEVVFSDKENQQMVNISLIKIGSNSPPVIIPAPIVYENVVSLTFTGKCPKRDDLEIRPSVYVFFREKGSATAFQYLGYMNKGRITTNYLLKGKTYEFQIVYGGEAYQVSQKIEQLNYNLSLDMAEACNF